jgi:hypothetical protein
MFRENRFRNNVSLSFLNYLNTFFIIVQFEEKKFLEAARKTIQTSVTNAGTKLESESVLHMGNK